MRAVIEILGNNADTEITRLDDQLVRSRELIPSRFRRGDVLETEVNQIVRAAVGDPQSDHLFEEITGKNT